MSNTKKSKGWRGLYFAVSRDHVVLKMFDNFSDARDHLHANINAQYVARIDGVVMAYMSREGNYWRPITKVLPETKKAMLGMAKLYSRVYPPFEDTTEGESD